MNSLFQMITQFTQFTARASRSVGFSRNTPMRGARGVCCDDYALFGSNAARSCRRFRLKPRLLLARTLLCLAMMMLCAAFASAAPVLTLPTSPMKAFSLTTGGGTVSFTVTATDSVDGTVTPTATPPSGSAFPVGDTTVNVSATNSLGQTTTGSFVVRVAQSVLTRVDFYRLGETENGVAGANFVTAIDSVGGNNNLTAGAAVTYSTNVSTPVGLNGQSTMCANFAASNGGLIGQFFASSFQLDNFGVECFVTADGTDGVVVANRNPSTAGWTIHKSGAEWWVTWDGNRARVLAAPVSIGTRVHLALVRENGTARLFVNGTSVGSTTRAMSNPGTLARTEVGGTFTGRIDEVRYFTFTGGTFSSNELLVNSAIASTVTNSAPTITSNGGGATASINVAENTTAVTTVVATDTDTPAQTITYSKSGTNAGLFNINSGTGALTFITAPDFETGPGPFSVTVTATDSGTPSTLSDSQDLTINVTNVNEMPSFTKGADQSKAYGTNNVQIVEGWATAIDDGDSTVTQALTFSITGNTNAGMFLSAPVIDSAGTLTYRPNGTAGTATIGVTLTDDASINGTAALTTATQQFTITVAPNTAPTIAATNGTITFDAGTPATNTGTFSDPDGNATVTLTASSGTVTKDNAGTWSWTESGITKSKLVTITATDGALSATTTFAALADGRQPFAVANTGDSGAGSLREVITSAASTPKSVIDLSALSGTITLATALPAITGDVEIVGASNLTLASSTLIVGAGQKLKLSGVTLSGAAPAIANTNGSIDIANCAFTNNTGAITNVINGTGSACVISIRNNTFSNNATAISTTNTSTSRNVSVSMTGNTFLHGIGIDEAEPDGTSAPIFYTHVDEVTTTTFAGTGNGTFSFSSDDDTQWASFTVNGTSAADTMTITSSTITLGSEVVTYGAAEDMTIDAGSGADGVTMTSASPDTPLTINAGADGGTFALNAASYTGRVSLAGFATTTINCASFSGGLSCDGAVPAATITGDVTGNILAASFGSIDIGGTLSGAVQTSGLITTISMSEMAASAYLVAGGIGDLNVWGDLLGTVYVAHPGTITNLYVGATLGGSVTLIEDYPDLTTGVLGTLDVSEISETGVINAGRINTIKVAGDMGGSITTSGAGVIQNMFAGSVSGSVAAKEDITVNGTTTINGGGQIFTTANGSKLANASRSQLAYDSKNKVFYVISNNVLYKLDINGNELWVVDYGQDWRLGGVAIDTKGNIVLPMTISNGGLNQLFINILDPQSGSRSTFVALLPTGFQQFKGFVAKPVGVTVDAKSGDIFFAGYSYGTIAWNASSNPKTGDLSAVTVTGTDERVWVLRMNSAYNTSYCRDIGATGRKGTGTSGDGDWGIGIAPYTEPNRNSGLVVAYNGPGISYVGLYNIAQTTKSSVIVRSMSMNDGSATSRPLTLAWKEQKYRNASDVRLTDVYNTGSFVRILGTCTGSSLGVTKGVDSPGSAAIDTWWNNTPETPVTFAYGVKLGLQFGGSPLLQATDATFTNTNVVQASQTVKFTSEAIFSGIKAGAQPGTLAIDNARDYLLQLSGPQSISVFDQTGTIVRTLTTSSMIYNDGPGGWWDTTDAATAEFRRICKTPEGFAVVGGVDRYGTRCCFVARFNDDFSIQRNIKYIRNINQVYALTAVGDGGVIVAGSFVGSCSQYLAGGTTVTGPAGVNTTFVGRFLSDNSFSWLSNPTPNTPTLEVFPCDVTVNSVTPSVFYLLNWQNNDQHRLVMCDTNTGARIADRAWTAPGCQAYAGITVGNDGRPTVHGLFSGNISASPVNLAPSGGESAFAIVFQSPTEASSAVNMVSGTRTAAPGVAALNKAYFGVAQLVGVSTTGRINYLATEAAPGRVAADTNGNVYQLGKVLGTHSSRLQGVLDSLVRISPNGTRTELLRSDGVFTTNLPVGMNGAQVTNEWGDAQFNAVTVASDGSVYVVGSAWWSRKALTFASTVGNSNAGADTQFYPGKKVGFVLRYSPVAFNQYSYRMAIDMLWRTTDTQNVVVSDKQGLNKNNRLVALLQPAYDEPEAIVVKGNACYIAGRFTRCGGLLNGKKPFLGYDSLIEQGFVCKINAVALPDSFNVRSGTVTGVWETTWDTPSAFRLRTGTIAVGSDNSVFFSYTRGLGINYSSTANAVGALVKWNASGAWQWEISDANIVSLGLGAYLDSAGNAYLLARASGNTKFGGNTFSLPNAASVPRLTRVAVNANGIWSSQKDLGPIVNPGSLNGIVNGAAIQNASIGGDLNGTIRAAGQGAIGNIEIFGNMSGSISALIDDTPGSGSIGSITVGGVLSGNVMSTTLTQLDAQNVAPTASIIGGVNVTVNEGATATNGGVFNTLNAATMNVSATVGTVVAGANGTWSWSLAAADGPLTSQSVTISGIDASSNTTSTTFQLTISNIAPTGTLTPSSSTVPVNTATAPSVGFSNLNDPSANDTSAGFHYAFDFDNDGTYDLGDGTYANSPSTANASVPLSLLTTANTTVTITATIIDKDNGSTTRQTRIDVLNPLQAWRLANFGSISSFSDRAHNGDGVPNLLKYAFNTALNTNGMRPLDYTGNTITTGGIRTTMNAGTPRAEFVRRKDAGDSGLNYTLQFSADLVTWTNDTREPDVLADDGTNEVVCLSYPMGAKFFRVSVGTP
ncbi:MAG: cadherin domain-containing protein [Verrucomicrobia bacterium]|nr:cadherin domain-containing protein [Verrucomicrobiota bacterium]